MITENLNKNKLKLNSFWADCRNFIICTLVFNYCQQLGTNTYTKKSTRRKINIFILQTFIGEKLGLAWTNLSALTFLTNKDGFKS